MVAASGAYHWVCLWRFHGFAVGPGGVSVLWQDAAWLRIDIMYESLVLPVRDGWLRRVIAIDHQNKRGELDTLSLDIVA